MPLITDPDQLTQDTEITLDEAARTIQCNIAGNLSTDGVLLQVLYSFLKEEWLVDAGLVKTDFPMTPITDESFELKDGWDFLDDASRYLIRTGGWTVLNTSNNITQQWSGIIGLGFIESDDQIYFDQGAGAQNFQLTGQVNQAVQILSDPNGDGSYGDGFDYRNQLNIFTREQGQLFSSSNIGAIGVSSLASQAYRFPLSTGNDLNIVESDANIGTQAPYTGMSITYFDTPQARDIGGSNFNFGIIIDGNNGTLEEIYEFVQYQLRQSSDIDDGAGSVIGNTADALLRFIGGTGDGSGSLETLNATNPNGGGTGVFIDNFLLADTNRVTFSDNTETNRTFPFVASLQVNFDPNLQADANAKFWVFFEDAGGNTFGDASAIIVNDNDDTPMQGDVLGRSSVSLSFDYDGNNQGGRTPATPANIVVVALGLNEAQYVQASATINRSTSNTVTLVSAVERNYSNV